jgi:hypothetical protein
MEIPNFWNIGPHDPLPVEDTWNQFIIGTGGKIVSRILHKSPSFENADYLYQQEQIVLELKEIETEFTNSETFKDKFIKLIERLLKENPNWKPFLIGGSGKVPQWFLKDFVRIVRPNISRILKKANRQIRDTKNFFSIKKPYGVLLFVNDGFTGVTPDLVFALAGDILTTSYSSIDSFVYLTVNRYIEIKDSNVPRLVWWPIYSNRTDNFLKEFINKLGRKWFEYLEIKIGPFTKKEETSNGNIIKGAKAIVLPK